MRVKQCEVWDPNYDIHFKGVALLVDDKIDSFTWYDADGCFRYQFTGGREKFEVPKGYDAVTNIYDRCEYACRLVD